MRTGYWLLIVVLAVAVSGLLATWRGTRQAAANAAIMNRVGTVKDIMEGIVDPSADVVWESVATNITAAGVAHHALMRRRQPNGNALARRSARTRRRWRQCHPEDSLWARSPAPPGRG